ncbi:MAG: anhydro-N-acetylmuramic acid kinase [Bacteroidota bacterium]
MKVYKVIGLMSGTSLDGVDIAYCEFSEHQSKWSYKIISAETYQYEDSWKKKLSDAMNSDALQFISLHKEYGSFLGKLVSNFISRNKISVDFIASHGHTIFHQPDKRLTFQIGDGSEIAAVCGLPVVYDFRSGDVALGGQGAPLVPIGDKLLFSDYDFCLNLGGFANISFDKNDKRIAFDICPVNIILNRYANLLGKPFDEDGLIASKGHNNKVLFSELNNIEYYSLKPPKSLGREWVEKQVIPITEKFDISIENKLRTLCEHMAWQIACVLNSEKKGKVLVTGGGAFNKYLISGIPKFSSHEIIIPEKMTVEYKEALIFAFLGLLRMNNQVNCLASVTGAGRDHSSGAVYLP